MTNFLRHRGLIHGLDKFGNPIDEATRRRFIVIIVSRSNYRLSHLLAVDLTKTNRRSPPRLAPQIPPQKCRSKGLLDEYTT